MDVRRLLLAMTVLAAALTAAVALPASAAGPQWAPAARASIHPGVQTFTAGAQCTANFVFTDGRHVFLGQAAHCASTSSSTTTNGCQAKSLPLGTRVQVQGARHPGVLVYSSWITMQRRHERSADVCAYNDFALVRLAAADVRRVNPSVPFWGGPTGLGTHGTTSGETVLSYGASELRLGLSALSPKQGMSLGDYAGGWERDVYTATPGVPGDSGSGFLDADGRAVGVLATLQFAPEAGANGVGDLAKELAYANRYAGTRARLVPGTVPFSGPLP